MRRYLLVGVISLTMLRTINGADVHTDPASDLAISIAEACVEGIETQRNEVEKLEKELADFKASQGRHLRGRRKNRFEELTRMIEANKNKIADWELGNLDVLQNPERKLSSRVKEGSFGKLPESLIVRDIIDNESWIGAYSSNPSFTLPIVQDSTEGFVVGQEIEIEHPICVLNNPETGSFGESRLVGYVVPEQRRQVLFQEVRRLVVQHYVGVPLEAMNANDNEILELVLGPVETQVGERGVLTDAKILQIIGSGLLASQYGRTWLLKGISTENMADGDALAPACVRVTGTTTYETVIGSTKTVYVLELLQSSEKQELIDQFREQLQQSMRSKIEEVDQIIADQDSKLASETAANQSVEKSEREETAMAKFRAAQIYEETGNERLRNDRHNEILKEYPNTKAAKLVREFQSALSQTADSE